jgi:hypothetical protein
MTAPFATLNGIPIVSGKITIPLWNMWAGDIQLATDAPVTGAATLVLGNITLQGTVYRSDPFAGQTSALVIAGGGGWRKVLPAKQYTLAGGVMLSMLLKDAAAECGESVNVPTDTAVGTGWVRTLDKGSKLLHTLRELGWMPGWYIDVAGVTQIAQWPTTTVTSDFQVVDQRPDIGRVTIATEDYASWLPGCTFTTPLLAGTFTNGGVTYRFENDGTARLEVLTAP